MAKKFIRYVLKTEELNSTTARVFQLAYANRKKKHQNKNDVEPCDMEINENQALSGSHTVLERSNSDHTQAENNNRTSVINDLKAVVELRQSSSNKKLSRTDRKIARHSLVEVGAPTSFYYNFYDKTYSSFFMKNICDYMLQK